MQSLVGIWKLVEARAFDEAGHEVPSPLGPEPMGVLLIEAKRIMVTAGDGRVTLPRERRTESPRTTKLYDRTSERLTLAEVERIRF